MDEEKLNEKQEMAIELALTGMSDGEIARKIKVSRQWVNTWRNHNTVFIDALEERRRTLRERHQDSVIGLVEKAIEVMKNALDDEDPKIRLQAVKLVLNTAALKDSMKEKKEPNEREAVLRELAEALGWAGKELGYTEPGKINNTNR
jgi:transposase